MSDLPITPELVGQRVCHATRPEWGIGVVLRVQQISGGETPSHRVSIQFSSGHRQVLVPPARLQPPTTAPTRAAGWLDQIAGRTLDDRLTDLPERVALFLGTAGQRVLAVAELYDFSDDSADLVHWARRQTDVADPLTHWTRDELAAAFARFTGKRDEYLRSAAALVRREGGAHSLAALVSTQPAARRERMLRVL